MTMMMMMMMMEVHFRR